MECAKRGCEIGQDGGSVAGRGRWLTGLTLLGLVVAGGLALSPVRAPEENPQPLLERAAVLRQAVTREPENALLLLQLSRTEFRLAKLAAMRAYAERYPEGAGESFATMRTRYEAWLRGSLYASPGGRRAHDLARRAAGRASTKELRAEAFLMLGAIAWERGQESEAIGAFRAACRARPDWLPSWTRLAAAAASRGDMALYRSTQRRLDALRSRLPQVPPADRFSLGMPALPPGAGDG
jgi:hypothetical protein